MFTMNVDFTVSPPVVELEVAPPPAPPPPPLPLPPLTLQLKFDMRSSEEDLVVLFPPPVATFPRPLCGFNFLTGVEESLAQIDIQNSSVDTSLSASHEGGIEDAVERLDVLKDSLNGSHDGGIDDAVERRDVLNENLFLFLLLLSLVDQSSLEDSDIGRGEEGGESEKASANICLDKSNVTLSKRLLFRSFSIEPLRKTKNHGIPW